MKKLILFPLSILILLSLLSMLGVASVPDNFGVGTMGYGTENTNLLYDENGHPVCYYNGTAYGGENGAITYKGLKTWFGDTSTPTIKWVNGSSIAVANYYDIYTDTNGQNQLTKDEYETIKAQSAEGSTFNIWTSIGLIGLIVGLTILAGVIGIKIVGTGESDTSVQTILIGTGYVSLWGIFSVLGLNLLVAMGTWGGVTYFILTCMYAIGIIMTLGNN